MVRLVSLIVLALANVAWAQNSIPCSEAESDRCDASAGALCDLAVVPTLGCYCDEGFIGTGCNPTVSLCLGGPPGCSGEGWSARVTFDVTSAALTEENGKISNIARAKKVDWADKLFGLDASDIHQINTVHHSLSTVHVWNAGSAEARMHLTINMLFPERVQAKAAADVFNDRVAAVDFSFATSFGDAVYGAELVAGIPARVYRWKVETTASSVFVGATGMQVDFVQFRPNCKSSGCWVFDVTYTTGNVLDTFNTFYLPSVQDTESAQDPWQEDLSFDRNWQLTPDVWNTFFPTNFPCGSNVPSGVWTAPTVTGVVDSDITPTNPFLTTCCMKNFLSSYRTVQGFADYFTNVCTGDLADVISTTSNNQGNLDFPTAQPFLAGAFTNLNADATYRTTVDPFIGQHTARIEVDEVELRRKSGLLTGSVGVEYTIDTFLGFANFRVTGNYVLDSAALQVNIHLEKTNFFSVSTEGANAYTFLEYVNMRLITIYKEDVVFGGETEDGESDKQFGTNFFQTSDEDSADYVQVTFTMGADFSPNLNDGLIPITSVRAGKGTFFEDAQMEHKCTNYLIDPANFWLPVVTGLPATTSTEPILERRREHANRRSDDETAFANNETWGPLNTCSEQSRCMYMTFKHRTADDEDNLCGEGGCEWEACIHFSKDHDPGCRVWNDGCDLQWLCYDLMTQVPSECDRCTDFGENVFPTTGASVPDVGTVFEPYDGLFAISTMVNLEICHYTSLCSEQPGDMDKESHYGNLFMWCDQTTDDCPASLNYPDPQVNYFKPLTESGQNISLGKSMCQRGKPGQKLFFVMRDGDKCSILTSSEQTYPISSYTKRLWRDWAVQKNDDTIGLRGDAQAICEPRSDINNQCPECTGGLLFDNEEFDGKQPCGCSETFSPISGGGTDTSGFDSCTTTKDTLAVNSECVWTVTLPSECEAEPCPCGVDDKDGSCITCPEPSSTPGSCKPGDHPPGQVPLCCGPFNSRLCQTSCAPGADMCVSPQSTPDSFVSFNIPLGMDWYPDPSEQLDQNVFVHIVVNALDASGCADPSVSGCEPLQVKTTLFGSIPVVAGGINIFCDGVRAKTDLKDVANADIVVGTASSVSELSRLRILRDIASTTLNKFDDSGNVIDSPSIESGFLTLIVKGNSSFFNLRQTVNYGLELEDLITIHIMEPESTAFDAVQDLLDAPAQDNYDTTSTPELDTDGYELNGAFRFTVDRVDNRAFLEPTAALLDVCPFNANNLLPTATEPFPTTCITRRDVRYRGFPHRLGALSTAMEVVPLQDVDAETCYTSGGADKCFTDCTIEQNSQFMQTVLGGSGFTEGLGADYSCVIAKQWKLNGRYRRAWWINPSYEWTPSLTGGQPIFTISQKIFLFALINLNENMDKNWQPSRSEYAGVDVKLERRRVLLSNTDSTGSGIGGGLMEFDVSPSTMMANALGVPVDKVATWRVVIALTAEQACMEPAELQAAIRKLLNNYALEYASNFESLLITAMTLDLDGVVCDGRRSLSRQLLQNPTAAVDMMIIFGKGGIAQIDSDALAAEDGIMSFTELDVSPKIEQTNDVDVGTPPPSESSSTNLGLIVGCAAGGVVGLGLIVAGGVMFWKKKQHTAEAEVANALPDLAALKNQLSESA